MTTFIKNLREKYTHHFLIAVSFFLFTIAQAQQDIPRIMSYQGQVMQSGRLVATGDYSLIIRFYGDPEGKTKVWEASYSAHIVDGIFNIMLGGGEKPLPSTSAMNRPLWVGVAIAGEPEMKPYAQLASAPYALNVPDKSITKEKLSDELQQAVAHLGSRQDPQYHTDSVDYWGEHGNHSLNIDSSEFLGTSDYSDLILKVYGNRVLRYYYNSTSVNIVGGYHGNSLSSNKYGQYLAGGGKSGDENWIDGDYSFLGAGLSSHLRGAVSVLGGGEANLLVGQYCFLGGGKSNTIGQDVSLGGKYYSAILGGYGNTLKGDYGAILGGKDLTLTGDNSVGFNAGTAVTFSGSKAMYLNDVDVHLDNIDGTARKLIFYEPHASGTNISTFKAQPQASDINYLFPNAQGAANTYLKNDGSGTLSWDDPVAGLNAWKLIGNSGLTDGTNNFFGTLTAVPIRILTNNMERVRVLATGEIGVGTSTPSTLLHLLLENSTTTTVDNILTIGRNSSGTVANGFGGAISFQLESSTTPNQDAGQIQFFWTDASDVSKSSRYDLYLSQNASLKRVWRAEYTGGSPNIIGGTSGNTVTPGVVGAFIGGGGGWSINQ